jgi:hypothetical protein
MEALAAQAQGVGGVYTVYLCVPNKLISGHTLLASTTNSATNPHAASNHLHLVMGHATCSAQKSVYRFGFSAAAARRASSRHYLMCSESLELAAPQHTTHRRKDLTS